MQFNLQGASSLHFILRYSGNRVTHRWNECHELIVLGPVQHPSKELHVAARHRSNLRGHSQTNKARLGARNSKTCPLSPMEHHRRSGIGSWCGAHLHSKTPYYGDWTYRILCSLSQH